MAQGYNTGLSGLRLLSQEEFAAIAHDAQTLYIVKSGSSVRMYLGDVAVGGGGISPIGTLTPILTGVTAGIGILQETQETEEM